MTEEIIELTYRKPVRQFQVGDKVKACNYIGIIKGIRDCGEEVLVAGRWKDDYGWWYNAGNIKRIS